MIKIEAVTLEEAYKNAALKLECSVTELNIEVVQAPSNGILGLFKKTAIIVATSKVQVKEPQNEVQKEVRKEKPKPKAKQKPKARQKPNAKPKKQVKKQEEPTLLNNTIMPESFVSTQDDEYYDMDGINFTADYEEEDSSSDKKVELNSAKEIAKEVEEKINHLFNLTCFKIDKIEVSAYDATTLLLEFKGEDSALLIGKEGYRYKALSYMIFNWINTNYQMQLRLEIAEFLKNQEESVARYLEGVYVNIDRDGKAQTKILDGVLVQIALRELRERYPNKYVAIRSTRDGLKFIIINEYYN